MIIHLYIYPKFYFLLRRDFLSYRIRENRA
ncbi:MAG: hypothetical protein METHAR1v1_950017 [Methanothrix sp.]|nr:MAG: hypothetical protein METHAR1v1_950017 [Methanothrix sp.]